MGFLDNTGLAHLWEKITTALSEKLDTSNLQTALDDNVPPVQFVLVMNGNTLSTVDAFVDIAYSLSYKPRRVMFVIVMSQSGGTVTSALELYPTMIDTDNRLLTLVGYFEGVRYTAELTAASVSSTMTGTLVAKSIVTVSDIPAASTAAPLMDGTAAAGTSTAYARADHVHPSDTSKLSTTGNAYRTASIPMGHLDATSTATVMTATVDGITELRDGVCMWLRNGVITSASGFTLNVNGLGAKPCYSSLAAESRSTTIFNINYALLMIYNSTRVSGGCWDIVYGVDTNTTYTPVKLGFGYTTCSTAEATTAKTASLSSYALTANGIVSVKFTNAVPANSTLNITSKGAKAIYYRGAAITDGVIKAGDTATFVYSTYYHLISIDRDEAPIQTVKVNGTALVPDANKAVDIPVPTVADVVEETGMVVQLTPTSTDLSGTMNRTGSEILTAYGSGKRIVAEVVGLDGYFEWNQAINGSMVTQFLYGSGSNRELIQVVAEGGSSTVYHAYHIAQLPTVTASDNGKFLRVVNGAWVAQATPAAESHSFGDGSGGAQGESFQTKSITDTGGYYTTDTVEGALQEIGAELSGINTLIGSGVIS